MTDPAWAWVAHLRAGGTTPWLDWLRDHDTPDTPVDSPAPERPGQLPGAAQLELVRRLAGRPGARAEGRADFSALADRVLRRSGPGRGMPDLPLLRLPDRGGSDPSGGVGAPAVDPAALPAGELVRTGIGLLVDLLVSGSQAAPPHPEEARRRPWARAFHLAGAPVTAAAVRAGLLAAGHVEGGRSPEVVILAEPLDAHLAQVWSTRVQHGAPARWRTFAARWARRDELPPSAELTTIAAFWAARVGPERVHVVAGPDPRRTAGEVLRLRPAEPRDPDPAGVTAEGVDLLRRLNSVLNVRVSAAERDRILRGVVGLLPQTSEDPAPALRVPPEHRLWVDARARALTDELSRGGYAVHGDLDRIAPRHAGRPHPRRPDVLALVLDTCLRLADREAGER